MAKAVFDPAAYHNISVEKAVEVATEQIRKAATELTTLNDAGEKNTRAEATSILLSHILTFVSPDYANDAIRQALLDGGITVNSA